MLTITRTILIRLKGFPKVQALRGKINDQCTLPLSHNTLQVTGRMLRHADGNSTALASTRCTVARGVHNRSCFDFSKPASLNGSFVVGSTLCSVIHQSRLGSRYIIILIPAGTLVNRATTSLEGLLSRIPRMGITACPSLPGLLHRGCQHAVFMLAPRQLLHCLTSPIHRVSCLIISRTRGIVTGGSTHDSLCCRTVIRTAHQFTAGLIFTSPDVTGPRLFLRLFNGTAGKTLTIGRQAMTRRQCFISLITRHRCCFSKVSTAPRRLRTTPSRTDIISLVLSQDKSHGTVVCVGNSLGSTRFTLQLTRRHSTISSSGGIRRLVGRIHRCMRGSCFLTDALDHNITFRRKGVPRRMHRQIRRTFTSPRSPVRFIIYASALLRKIGLPTGGVFILDSGRNGDSFAGVSFRGLTNHTNHLACSFSNGIIYIHRRTGQ